MPLSTTTKYLIAAGIVGAAVVATSSRNARRPKVDCPPLGPDGGTLAGVTYLERRSQGAPADAELPMVVVFHSLGATPKGFSGFYKSLKGPARVITPAGPFKVGSGHGWTTVASKTKNQEKFTEQLRSSADRIAEFLRQLRQCRPTVGRPIVTGSSQGGHMSYALASLVPREVMAAVALDGYLPTPMWNSGMARTVALHGTLDTTVPYGRTVEYWNEMKAKGAKLQTESFDVGHTVSKAMGKSWKAHVNAMLGAVA